MDVGEHALLNIEQVAAENTFWYTVLISMSIMRYVSYMNVIAVAIKIPLFLFILLGDCLYLFSESLLPL
jgi:hypothetical protein